MMNTDELLVGQSKWRQVLHVIVEIIKYYMGRKPRVLEVDFPP
jgi:hypothetical protein